MYHKFRISVIRIILLCAVFLIIISGCSSNNKEATFVPNSQTLTWDAPKTFTDSTALAEADITEYRVYYSTSHITQPTVSFHSVFFDPNTSVTPKTVSLKDINFQSTGTYFFVVTAVLINGMESVSSNEVSRQIN
jgi:hypothetical protein